MLAKSLIAVLLLSFIAVAYAAVIGTASIRAPAVLAGTIGGALTYINLTVTTGTGHVAIVGPVVVGTSTLQSAQTAARYAASYLHLNFSNYNFNYTIGGNSTNVTGPSGGAAMTLLAISALQHKQLRSDFTITGTISSNGTVGQIGGVYDKVSAAKQNGLGLVLVPAVPPGSGEAELYLLVQAQFGIPLVQVANVSQAVAFAFNRGLSGVQNQTRYNFTTIMTGGLPGAKPSCSNQCNTSAFSALVNYTINFTSRSIGPLTASPSFGSIGAQLSSLLNQDAVAASKGYLYAAANFAFQDYINAYYFGSHNATKASTLANLTYVQSVCSALTAPQLTTANYEYVLEAQVRQEWGNYTMNSTLSNFNSTAIDTDVLLEDLRAAATATGWCRASNFVYSYFANSTAQPVQASSSLANVALQRLDAATGSGAGLYLLTAQQAYRNKNYALTILDSDYGIAIANASASQLTTSQLVSAAASLAQNSTFGAWATEFAKESQLYSYEASATPNTTLAHSYAVSAYSAALLASRISSDTQLISNSLVPVSGVTETAALIKLLGTVMLVQELTIILLAVVIIALLVCFMLLAKLMRMAAPRQRGRRKR